MDALIFPPLDHRSIHLHQTARYHDTRMTYAIVGPSVVGADVAEAAAGVEASNGESSVLGEVEADVVYACCWYYWCPSSDNQQLTAED